MEQRRDNDMHILATIGAVYRDDIGICNEY